MADAAAGTAILHSELLGNSAGARRGRPMRSPIKWHGGKFRLCRQIIDLFPEHTTYVEPFGGGAVVLLNKPPAGVEVYNDLDQRLTRFFRVLRDRAAEFRRLLSLTPYNEIEFKASVEPTENEIEQARRDFVRWRMSLGGRGDTFSYTLHRQRRGMAGEVSGYLSAIDEQLPPIVERLRRVLIVNRPALEIIRTWDSPQTLFYCDPPYMPQTRSAGARDVYAVEMSREDHRQLAEVLRSVRGKVLLSGYPSPEYDQWYAGWSRRELERPADAAGGKKKARQTECLWTNYPLAPAATRLLAETPHHLVQAVPALRRPVHFCKT